MTFFQLKEPIPFDQVASNPWLLDSSTNLASYATHIYRVENLSNPKHLRAVLRLRA